MRPNPATYQHESLGPVVYLSRVVGCDEERMSTAWFSCVYFSLPNVRQQDEVVILNFVFSLLVFEFARPASIIG